MWQVQRQVGTLGLFIRCAADDVTRKCCGEPAAVVDAARRQFARCVDTEVALQLKYCVF